MYGIQWEFEKNIVRLILTLNWEKYSEGVWNLKLPPPAVGVCKYWCNVLSEDEKVSTFTMEWDKRKIDWDVMYAFIQRIKCFVV